MRQIIADGFQEVLTATSSLKRMTRYWMGGFISTREIEETLEEEFAEPEPIRRRQRR